MNLSGGISSPSGVFQRFKASALLIRLLQNLPLVGNAAGIHRFLSQAVSDTPSSRAQSKHRSILACKFDNYCDQPYWLYTSPNQHF